MTGSDRKGGISNTGEYGRQERGVEGSITEDRRLDMIYTDRTDTMQSMTGRQA